MLVLGMGTIPGSLNTARRWATINRNMTVLKITTLAAPHNLEKGPRVRGKYVNFVYISWDESLDEMAFTAGN